jgi:methionyl aminopeptidase
MKKNKNNIYIKSPGEIKIMKAGGSKLAEVKTLLKEEVGAGIKASDIEKLANVLIKKSGGEASFKMVKDYSWATCVNVNDGVVHGIPSEDVVFEKGDIVSVDVGIYYKGFHTDTSFSVGIELDGAKEKFLETGRRALKKAIKEARPGARVFDISLAIEKELRRDNLNPVKALVGHGVGRSLHEEPQIPCFVSEERENTPEIPEGAVIAIEVMYTEGTGSVQLEADGWTISTRDGKISALFEETVAIVKNGNIILTKAG